MLKRVNQTDGFTLIEIMVAVSIFVVVAMIASGALITAQRISQKSRAIKLVMDNLNFALDSMAFKMRSGGAYVCLDSRLPAPPGCNPGSSECPIRECAEDGGVGVFFQSADEEKKYVYQITAAPGKGIEYWETDFADFVQITRADLTIERLRFYVFNSQTSPPAGGTYQLWPRVLLTIYGQTEIGGETTSFGVQTSVTER